MSLQKIRATIGISTAVGLAALFGLASCNYDPSDDDPVVDLGSGVSKQNILSDDFMLGRLADGIHRLSIPADLGSGEGRNCLIVKDWDGTKGYVVVLENEADSSVTAYAAALLAKGDFLSVLEDGINDLTLDGRYFEDGQARTYTIIKDWDGTKGYALSAGSRPAGTVPQDPAPAP